MIIVTDHDTCCIRAVHPGAYMDPGLFLFVVFVIKVIFYMTCSRGVVSIWLGLFVLVFFVRVFSTCFALSVWLLFYLVIFCLFRS